MPTELVAEYEAARAAHREATARLAEVLEQIAVVSVTELFPAARTITVHGEADLDCSRLRLFTIADADGSQLWAIDEPGADELEDAISEIDSEYLDWLIDITGDDWLGEHELDMTATT